MSLNLSHRIPEYDSSKPDPISFFDAHMNVSDRAEATLLLLQSQFIRGDSQDLNSSVIFSALEAIRHDLLDLKVIVEHYHEAQKQGK